MKLVEILARELEEWPEGVTHACVGAGNDCSERAIVGISFTRNGPPAWDGRRFSIMGSPSYVYWDVDSFIPNCFGLPQIPSNIVTREMWEAERARQAPQPDWSKAPEGATHWALTGGINGHHVWYKVGYIGYKYQYSDEMTGWKIGKGEKPLATNAIPRPTTPQWRGPEDGLPPVGEEVECEISGSQWAQARVVAHDMDGDCPVAVCRALDSYYAFSAKCLRPVRTPRDKWIEAAERTLEENTSLIASSFQLGILFDAGLAKLPEDGE